MLNYISTKSAFILLKRKIITQDELNIYIYGFNLFYSSIFTGFTIVLISSLYYNIFFGIIFIFFFALPRFFVGGYHASSFGKCFLITNLVFILMLFAVSYAELKIFIIFLYLFSLFFIFFFSKRTLDKILCHKFLLLQTFEQILCICFLLLGAAEYSFAAMESTIIMVFFIIIGRRERHG